MKEKWHRPHSPKSLYHIEGALPFWNAAGIFWTLFKLLIFLCFVSHNLISWRAQSLSMALSKTVLQQAKGGAEGKGTYGTLQGGGRVGWGGGPPCSLTLSQPGCMAGRWAAFFPWDWSPLEVCLPRLHLSQVWRHCRAEALPAVAAAPLYVVSYPHPKYLPSTGIRAAQSALYKSSGAEGNPGNHPRHSEVLRWGWAGCPHVSSAPAEPRAEM